MISTRLEEITPYSHPALSNVAIERRKRSPFLPSRFQHRLKTWTTAEQERQRHSQILDLLRFHVRWAAMGGGIHG